MSEQNAERFDDEALAKEPEQHTPAPQEEPRPIERPVLGISDAAEATGKHRNTIIRKLKRNEFPNSHQDEFKQWWIPPGDLEAAGLRLHAPRTGEAPTEVAASMGSDPEEVTQLREEVIIWKTRAKVAEALAGERDRALLIAENALRALGAREPPKAATEPQSAPESNPGPAESVGEQRQGFWARFLGLNPK